MALVLDTGPLIAALDADDQRHEACRDLLAASRERRVIPSPVLPEVDYWCRKHLGHEAFVDLLEDVRRGAFSIEDLRSEDYRRVAEVCTTYSDLRIGFVDAAVLAVVERLREPKLATLDQRHFRIMRPRHVDSLELLPSG